MKKLHAAVRTKKPSNKVTIAKTAGFCFGVRRAVDLAEKAAISDEKVYTMGPLIHNPQEVKRLEKKGVKPVISPWRLKKATLLLRTHGIPLKEMDRLEHLDVKLVDAVCPFVKRAKDIVKRLAEQGYHIIVVGDRTHPEVVAIVSYANSNCTVIKHPDELKKVVLQKKVAVVSQTTQNQKNFAQIVSAIRKKRPDVQVYNTICRATMDRQSDARALAGKVDVVIVIGGKNSGNTRRLHEICREYSRSYHIEQAAEIRPAWLRGVARIGITAGASTPDWVIQDVKKAIASIRSCSACGKGSVKRADAIIKERNHGRTAERR